MKRRHRDQAQPAADGFTIIEVLIVLAIAGIIMMIVFEAIPALTRNNRNNQRRQDVNMLLQAVSHYELNNAGSVPDSGSNFLQYDASKFTIYNASSVGYWDNGSTASKSIRVYDFPDANTANQPPNLLGINNNLAVIEVANYNKCNSNVSGAPTTGAAGYNDVVALFAVEAGSGTTPQCQEL